jgi:hypothetical protein
MIACGPSCGCARTRPHQVRWLDLTTAASQPAIRIGPGPAEPAPTPDVTMTRHAHSPGELLLDVVAG